MRALVKMDEKGRFRLPNKIRKILKLKPKQTLSLEVKQDTLILKFVHEVDENNSKMLHDMVVTPGRSKIKITKEVLDKMKDEMWSGS